MTGFIATGPRLAVQLLDDELDPFGDAGYARVAGDADSQAAWDRRRWRAEDTLAARGCWLGTTGTTAAAVRVADTHNGTRLFLDKGWGGEFNNCY